jgi:hypothetical protein
MRDRLDIISHAAMLETIDIARVINAARRRPPRTRLEIATTLATYAASIVDDLSAEDRASFSAKLLQLAAQIRDPAFVARE